VFKLKLDGRTHGRIIGDLFLFEAAFAPIMHPPVPTGGPGESGVTQMQVMAQSVNATGGLGAQLPLSVLERFDIISWDPRGVGLSREISCFGPNQEEEMNRIFTNGSLNYFPMNRIEAASWWSDLGKYTAACSKSASKELLPFMSTADAANDLELLRRALVEQRHSDSALLMNYYGMSYGTVLGVGLNGVV